MLIETNNLELSQIILPQERPEIKLDPPQVLDLELQQIIDFITDEWDKLRNYDNFIEVAGDSVGFLGKEIEKLDLSQKFNRILTFISRSISDPWDTTSLNYLTRVVYKAKILYPSDLNFITIQSIIRASNLRYRGNFDLKRVLFDRVSHANFPSTITGLLRSKHIELTDLMKGIAACKVLGVNIELNSDIYSDTRDLQDEDDFSIQYLASGLRVMLTRNQYEEYLEFYSLARLVAPEIIEKYPFRSDLWPIFQRNLKQALDRIEDSNSYDLREYIRLLSYMNIISAEEVVLDENGLMVTPSTYSPNKVPDIVSLPIIRRF